jgi:AcrR family transcriptional regulator
VINTTGPKRRIHRANTRTLILESGLRLFNDDGVAKVSSNRIAAKLDISSGNLYYHFKNKEQIVEWLIRRFDERLVGIMSASAAVVALDEMWLVLHLMFEAIQEYRFIYRDVDYLVNATPRIAKRVQDITERQLNSVREMCHGLARASVILANSDEVDSLALQMTFTTTCWLTFVRLLQQSGDRSEDAGYAAYQALTLLTPYLEPQARAYLTFLRSKYVKHA